ncbi:MAG: 3-deoxy-D-manno-octulosonic acid transferase [Lewinellaceae bacterium]|nr:3-deoxy-D-manno-octulosonic acid transferase [Saprospiraceae bacterium]MCB9330896.1 3-deoxy-D-manno-octulosonic acid transferase [Lewinellaceae bacterium]
MFTHVLYDLAIRLMRLALRLAAVFHPKARAWVAGRRNWRTHYKAAFRKSGKVLWVHVASLGEFEQGRPIIEAFRERHPDWQIVLSFFSPSGFAVRKNYPHADFVCYLPADTPRNARDFLNIIQPDLVIFVKYEFWANILFELKRRATPTLLVSALFRPGQPFFKWYGGFWRQILRCFEHIFAQNEYAARLLRQTGFDNITVAGDTRIDRVLRLAEQVQKNAVAERFLEDSGATTQPPAVSAESMTLIAGSTWPADEALLLPLLNDPAFAALHIIIAPHEPSEKHLAQLTAQLTQPYLRYSACANGEAIPGSMRVLLIDNVGLLNNLYAYGRVAYIGGGFGKGIHNTLEPAAFGLPILFGPKYEKFEEARQFVARGGAFPVHNAVELAGTLRKLQDPEVYTEASRAVKAFLEENRGATNTVLQYLEKFHF